MPEKKEAKKPDDQPLWKQFQEDERTQDEWRHSRSASHEPRRSLKPDRGIMKPIWAKELRRKKSVGFTPSTEDLRRKIEYHMERSADRY